MTKTKEFRDHSVEELESNLIDLRKKLYEVKNEEKQAKKLEKPHQLHLLKKDIARLLTVLREKQLAAQPKPN